ncbi:uncharacterized protein FJT64_011375 [Amphibalanus amphitrite]|uniref:SAM domain-containing protein n=1 Tax=Amphibalanus amphitrite TaxID=1232801 RepID=A0A6A4V9Q1_AMPAM|nr:uncharacterized protein FJT64_011375 [Amphibalanus amphitrite]
MDSGECSVDHWLGFFMGAGIPNRVAADYAVTFSDNRMRLDMLPDLSKDYLRDMNITLMGDVIAILKHAKSVSQKTVSRVGHTSSAPIRPGFRGPDSERAEAPRRTTAAAASASGASRTGGGSTRFTITGLGGISAAVQPHQRRPLGLQPDLLTASGPPRQKITFDNSEPGGAADPPRRTVGTVRTRVEAGAVVRRRVMSSADSPDPDRAPPPRTEGVRSAAARERLAGRDQGFRSAATREVRDVPVRVRTTRESGGEVPRTTGSRLKPPPALARPTVVRTRPVVEEEWAEERPRPVASRLKPPPAAGVKARLGAGGGGQMRLTTAGGKVIKLKGSSVYSRLGDTRR